VNPISKGVICLVIGGSISLHGSTFFFLGRLWAIVVFGFRMVDGIKDNNKRQPKEAKGSQSLPSNNLL
jgi:hypothetical protein